MFFSSVGKVLNEIYKEDGEGDDQKNKNERIVGDQVARRVRIPFCPNADFIFVINNGDFNNVMPVEV